MGLMKNRNKVNYKEQILIEYLQQYTPAERGEENIIYKSSQDIADELSEMVLLAPDEVSEKLISLGYHLGLDPALQLRWMMNRP